MADEDMKSLSNDPKNIYHATDEQTTLAQLDEVKARWKPKYPDRMNRWYENIYKFEHPKLPFLIDLMLNGKPLPSNRIMIKNAPQELHKWRSCGDFPHFLLADQMITEVPFLKERSTL